MGKMHPVVTPYLLKNVLHSRIKVTKMVAITTSIWLRQGLSHFSLLFAFEDMSAKLLTDFFHNLNNNNNNDNKSLSV